MLFVYVYYKYTRKPYQKHRVSVEGSQPHRVIANTVTHTLKYVYMHIRINTQFRLPNWKDVAVLTLFADCSSCSLVNQFIQTAVRGHCHW